MGIPTSNHLFTADHSGADTPDDPNLFTAYEIASVGAGVVSVTDPRFAGGAKGDGVTDDTAAFNAARLDRVAAGGGTVYIPPTASAYMIDASYIAGLSRLPASSGVSYRGAGPSSYVKVLPNLRATAVGIAPFYVNTGTISDITYSDFTLDFNGQNNLFITGYAATGAVNRTGGFGVCTNIVYERMVFKNAAGHHFVLLGTTGSKKCRIINCTFDECGLSIAGNQDTDHSSIYLDADDSEVSGNVFTNSGLDTVATAIETHGSNLRVHDNKVVNYATGANCGGDVRNTSDIIWHDNEFRNVLDGFVLYTAASWTFSRIKIHDNIVGLREAVGGPPPGRGVYAPASTMVSSANGTHLAIQNNEIFCETLAQLAVVTVGIELFRWDDVLIDGNKIHDVMGEGIKFSSEATPRTMSRITVINNHIKDVGLTSTAANKRAIFFGSFASAGQEILNVDIRGNTLIALASPSAGTTAVTGIDFNNGTFTDVRITGGNSIVGFTTQPIKKNATDSANLFFIEYEGPYNPFGLVRASLGSCITDTTDSPHRTYRATLVAQDGNNTVWTSTEWGTAAPLSGAYHVGDVVYNSAPAANGNVGWVCSAAGNPGTWLTFGTIESVTPGFGGTMLRAVVTELITLNTGGATTDSTANLLPTQSLILAVTAYVQTTVTTATAWAVGDPTTSTRFIASNGSLTAGLAKLGLQHMQGSVTTDAAGPAQTVNAKIRITTTGTPGAGAIRIAVYYQQFLFQTS